MLSRVPKYFGVNRTAERSFGAPDPAALKQLLN